jgi:hypothetical protein
MERQDAKALAERYIQEQVGAPDGDRYVIVDAAIREVALGWYFPYQTARFVETRNIEFSVVGNWPIFVTKQGEVLGPRRPEM